MKTVFRIILLGVLFTGFHQTQAQSISQYIDDEYVVENVFGINKATNGGLISGLYYRHSKVISEGNLTNYGIEIVNVKHPRESKETTFTGSSFIFGKSNYLLSIRPTYGREKVLFKKAPQQGARITGMVAAGPSFGLEVPYFIELINGDKEQYDPANNEHARQRIQGSAGPFRGLGQSSFVLGAHAKASLTFETNSTKKRVFGIEVGVSLDIYTREIEILPESFNKSSFLAGFVAIYFGRRR